MKGNKEVKISFWATHLTTIVSVTLVLLLIGIIALITFSSQNETRRLRERLEANIVMADTVSDEDAAKLTKEISIKPYVIDAGMISKEQALKDWHQETGENLEELFGVNPLSPEIYFRLKAEYSSPDSLKRIASQLKEMPGVADVAMPDSSMVISMNENIRNLSIVLGCIALVMVIISLILINNTVHLSIYARRFTIHTMQLVGGTNSFIKWPFVKNNMLAGLISGVLATAIMAVSLAAAPHTGWDDVAHYISWALFACISGGMIISGVIICGVAASIATSIYLKKEYDELFT